MEKSRLLVEVGGVQIELLATILDPHANAPHVSTDTRVEHLHREIEAKDVQLMQLRDQLHQAGQRNPLFQGVGYSTPQAISPQAYHAKERQVLMLQTELDKEIKRAGHHEQAGEALMKRLEDADAALNKAQTHARDVETRNLEMEKQIDTMGKQLKDHEQTQLFAKSMELENARLRTALAATEESQLKTQPLPEGISYLMAEEHAMVLKWAIAIAKDRAGLAKQYDRVYAADDRMSFDTRNILRVHDGHHYMYLLSDNPDEGHGTDASPAYNYANIHTSEDGEVGVTEIVPTYPVVEAVPTWGGTVKELLMTAVNGGLPGSNIHHVEHREHYRDPEYAGVVLIEEEPMRGGRLWFGLAMPTGEAPRKVELPSFTSHGCRVFYHGADGVHVDVHTVVNQPSTAGKPVSYNGVVYKSYTRAAAELRMDVADVKYRARSDDYPNVFLCNEDGTLL